MRLERIQSWLVLLGALVTLLTGTGLAMAASNPAITLTVAQTTRTPTSAVAATRTPTPAPQSGRITAAAVNVRSRPGTSTPILGRLKRGDRVRITGRRPGWVEISYPGGSNKRGWVSAGLVAVDVQRTSSPTAKPKAIPAPVIVGYQMPNIMWKWDGENAVAGQDWHFDILLMQGGNNKPYETIQANSTNAIKKNGVWTFAQPKPVLCETTMMMAVATQKDGKWAGWISPLSNGIRIGKPCECNDPCPGCGDGGCAD